jgi:hypothetical protein
MDANRRLPAIGKAFIKQVACHHQGCPNASALEPFGRRNVENFAMAPIAAQKSAEVSR